MPRASQLGRIRGVAGKGELTHFFGRVPTGACGAFQDRRRAESRVLGARGPGEIAQGLEALVGRDHVDPVAHFQASQESEHLVRGEIEGVERQPELRVTLERKETRCRAPIPAGRGRRRR